MRLLLLLAALVGGCVETVDLRIHRDRPTLVRLGDGVSAETLREASNIWRWLGPEFVEGEPAALLIERHEFPHPDVPGSPIGVFAFDPTRDRWIIGIHYDEPAVLAHELGHAMGLGHVEQEPCAVMSPLVCATAVTLSDLAEWERTN